MLMDKLSADMVVKDLKLVKTVNTNSYNGKQYLVEIYNGVHGLGYTVTHKKINKYYVNKENVVSKFVFDGDYSVESAVITSNNATQCMFSTVFGGFVMVTPIWELQLNCRTGGCTYKRVEEYKPITLAGSVLTVCWQGPISERVLRAKIRRKMREMINSGNAKLL